MRENSERGLKMDAASEEEYIEVKDERVEDALKAMRRSMAARNNAEKGRAAQELEKKNSEEEVTLKERTADREDQQSDERPVRSNCVKERASSASSGVRVDYGSEVAKRPSSVGWTPLQRLRKIVREIDSNYRRWTKSDAEVIQSRIDNLRSSVDGPLGISDAEGVMRALQRIEDAKSWFAARDAESRIEEETMRPRATETSGLEGSVLQEEKIASSPRTCDDARRLDPQCDGAVSHRWRQPQRVDASENREVAAHNSSVPQDVRPEWRGVREPASAHGRLKGVLNTAAQDNASPGGMSAATRPNLQREAVSSAATKVSPASPFETAVQTGAATMSPEPRSDIEGALDAREESDAAENTSLFAGDTLKLDGKDEEEKTTRGVDVARVRRESDGLTKVFKVRRRGGRRRQKDRRSPDSSNGNSDSGKNEHTLRSRSLNDERTGTGPAGQGIATANRRSKSASVPEWHKMYDSGEDHRQGRNRWQDPTPRGGDPTRQWWSSDDSPETAGGTRMWWTNSGPVGIGLDLSYVPSTKTLSDEDRWTRGVAAHASNRHVEDMSSRIQSLFDRELYHLRRDVGRLADSDRQRQKSIEEIGGDSRSKESKKTVWSPGHPFVPRDVTTPPERRPETSTHVEVEVDGNVSRSAQLAISHNLGPQKVAVKGPDGAGPGGDGPNSAGPGGDGPNVHARAGAQKVVDGDTARSTDSRPGREHAKRQEELA